MKNVNKNVTKSVDTICDKRYNVIIKGKGETDVSKKSKKLSQKEIIDLVIKAVVAAAALITAIKS